MLPGARRHLPSIGFLRRGWPAACGPTAAESRRSHSQSSSRRTYCRAPSRIKRHRFGRPRAARTDRRVARGEPPPAGYTINAPQAVGSCTAIHCPSGDTASGKSGVVIDLLQFAAVLFDAIDVELLLSAEDHFSRRAEERGRRIHRAELPRRRLPVQGRHPHRRTSLFVHRNEHDTLAVAEIE